MFWVVPVLFFGVNVCFEELVDVLGCSWDVLGS